jgi:hypothetical protein
VDPELEAKARLTLRGACERMTPQQWYNQKVTCASAFWANKGKRVKKEYFIGNEPTEEWAMTIDECMSVSKMSMRLYIAAKFSLDYLELSISFSGLSRVGRAT